jgi:glycyl-tRNA synthetase beta chain
LAKEYCNDELELITKAVELSKADLLTEMVYEFTDLQGVMGYYYAKAQGLDEKIALSIKEQYYKDEMPSSIESAIVSLSSKLDLLFGLFSINKVPTGSKDPLALRRAVATILKIVLEYKLDFDFNKIYEAIKNNYKEIDINKLNEFVYERLVNVLEVNPSVLRAVLSSGESNIYKIAQKAKAVEKVFASNSELSTTFKRIANIVKDVKRDDLSIDADKFLQDEEKELYAKFNEITNKKYDNYEEELNALVTLKPLLDKFFDNVFVNHEDSAIKTNRQNLIYAIYQAFRKIADIKEISI